MTQADFDTWTANQILVAGLPFTTYWDFLTAVARTPAFCGGLAGSMYSQFSEGQMCGKEAAAALAVIIAQTNANDATMVDATTGESVPFEYQGLSVLADPACDAAAGGDTSSDYCQAMGADASAIPDFYAAMNLDPNGELFVPRGAGYIYGADKYYWFSQVVYGDATVTDEPSLLQTDPVTWWMSGMLTWMIPMDGLPAPHNIIMGQWEPTDAEAELGIVDGFGAISHLLYGAQQCGMSGNPTANLRTGIYEGLLALIQAADGSWTAAETVFDWESNDCASNSLAAFPATGDYSQVPQFASPTVMVTNWADGAITEYASPTCAVVNHRTDYIVWKMDAFRDCVIAGQTARR